MQIWAQIFNIYPYWREEGEGNISNQFANIHHNVYLSKYQLSNMSIHIDDWQSCWSQEGIDWRRRRRQWRSDRQRWPGWSLLRLWWWWWGWWWWRWRRWWLWWSMFQHQKDVQSWLEARWQTMYTCSREETDLKRGRFDSLALLQQLQLDISLNLKCALVNCYINCEYLSSSTAPAWYFIEPQTYI